MPLPRFSGGKIITESLLKAFLPSRHKKEKNKIITIAISERSHRVLQGSCSPPPHFSKINHRNKKIYCLILHRWSYPGTYLQSPINPAIQGEQHTAEYSARCTSCMCWWSKYSPDNLVWGLRAAMEWIYNVITRYMSQYGGSVGNRVHPQCRRQ